MSNKLNRAVVVSACRTPIGRMPGSLTGMSEEKLMALCFNEVIRRAGIEADLIDDAYVGCSFPMERDNLCRKSILYAELPSTIPGSTISRTCASSMEALAQGAYKIMAGDAEAVLAGGIERMSDSSYALSFFKKSIKAVMKNELPAYESVIPLLEENDTVYISEMLAREYHIGRDEQDEYALESHRKAERAWQNGYFKDETLPIDIIDGENRSLFEKDELVTGNLTLEQLNSEPSFFVKDGSITKFNSAPMGDGAAAVLLMSEKKAQEAGMRRMAVICGMDAKGVTPNELGLGSVKIIQSILRKNHLSINDIDLLECNESFAVQSLAEQRLLGADSSRVNVNGGSISLGYPVGCTGLRICVTLIYEMIRRQSGLGLAAVCAGGGMGQGVLFKNSG